MVTRTKTTPLQEIYAITVRSESGKHETYRTTEEHPFWTVEEGWRKAGLLSEAYTLINRTGAPVQIIHVEKETELQDVYSIEVDEHHTYHVGEIGVWVHNAKCCDLESTLESLRAPNRRHYADTIDQRSVAKDNNTVIDRKLVDVNEDVQLIKEGKAVKDGNDYVINGRRYGQHNGTLYPISGNGLHSLNRIEYKTLGVLNKFGDTPQANQILRSMGVDQETLNKVLRIWQEVKK